MAAFKKGDFVKVKSHLTEPQTIVGTIAKKLSGKTYPFLLEVDLEASDGLSQEQIDRYKTDYDGPWGKDDIERVS